MGSEQKYKQLGADYHWHWAAQGSGNPYVQWVRRVLDHLPANATKLPPDGLPFESGIIVDFGCGDGYPASLLKSRGYYVVGIDVIPEALQVAREHTPEGNVFMFPRELAIETCDYVLALDSIEHLDDPSYLVELINRAAHFALVSCPAPGLDPHAVRDYTTDDLHALFAGCTVETLIDEGEHRLFKVTPERKDAANEDRDRGQSTSTPERADDERPQRQPQRSRARSARKGA